MTMRTGLIIHVACGLAVAVACKREETAAPTSGGEVAAVTTGDAGAATTGASAEGGADADAGAQGGPAEVAATGDEPADAATTGASEPAETSAAETSATAGTGGGSSKPAAESLPAPLHAKVDDKCGKDPGVGAQAQAFTLKTPEGKELTMASLRGKVVLLNFWGTWCKPCLKELPEFDRLVRHYRKHGAVLVAVATDTEPDGVLEFAKSRKISAKFALGGEELAKKYDSPNFPFSFVIDDKGMIRGSYRSFRPECLGKLEQDIRTSIEARKR